MKILYLGNSITFHGISHGIGWHGAWGMAASAEEQDYVHCLNRMLAESGKYIGQKVEYKVSNIADFERKPDTYDFSQLAELRDWEPDMLILRICENTPEEKVCCFSEAYLQLIQYFQRENLQIFSVGPFWQHDRKEDGIRCAAEASGSVFVSLKHLHSTDYQAIGLFEHAGVASHPSDKGMQAIAETLFAAIQANG